MKKNLLQIFIAILLFHSLLYSQILNSGFENWTDGKPDNWWTNNYPPIVVPVTQSNDSHSGSYAAKLEMVDDNGSPYGPQLVSYNYSVTQRYYSLKGYFKFFPTVATQSFSVQAYVNYQDRAIGHGWFYCDTTVNNYTEFDCQIDYDTPYLPDSIRIYIDIYDEAPTTSTGIAFVDDLRLSGPVDVKETTNSQTPASYKLFQNYPNPFNPSTKIKYSIPQESSVTITVFDVLGNNIETLVNENKPVGKYEVVFDASNLPSGVYYCRIKAGEFVETKKMILLR